MNKEGSLNRIKSVAEEYYRNAIALRPDHAPAINNLGVLLMSQKN